MRVYRLAWPLSGALGAAELHGGFVDGLTFVPSTLLLGLIFGAGAEAAGLGKYAAIAMSALVFSGRWVGASRRRDWRMI